ncbi:hypothetical protein HGA88_01110 [Candidatus Roizmanbacteria bacterium]|nr:hypothetical protein [Candidatus Roizmanbacteria bacterium]
MFKTKIGITLIASLILVSFVTLFINLLPSDSPVPHNALVLNLLQTPEGSVALQKLDVQDTYPSDYKLDIPNNYLIVQIFKNKEKLFEGKVVNKETIVFTRPLDPHVVVKPYEISLNNVVVYLPYIRTATDIKVLDEKSNLKLSIHLASYKLNAVNIKSNLCGNGICDSNENAISCFSDCKPVNPHVNKPTK